jgi:zinc transport system substrate-binding protein
MAHCTREESLAGGWPLFYALWAFAAALGAAAGAAAAPRVVVTVKPLHSLVAGVMEGVGIPDLIIRGAASPHTYSLRPSEARMLEGAELIFWIGEALETFMEKPLAAFGGKARIVEVMSLKEIALLPGRSGGAWDAHAEPASGHTAHDREHAAGHGAAARDGHLWLDPANAVVIVRIAAEELGRADPANRNRYTANAARVIARIRTLDVELQASLSPLGGTPFIVFHDAYQYLEKRYALRAVGSVAVSPERRPGAKRVREIREKIKTLGARCVFSEPQFPSTLLATLLEGSSARQGTLDPEGADLPAGPDAWFALMRSLGASLVSCLTAP